MIVVSSIDSVSVSVSVSVPVVFVFDWIVDDDVCILFVARVHRPCLLFG